MSAQTMKIYSIISKIEQVLEDSPKTKFGGAGKKVVEVDELFDLLGDLKVTIPEDIRRASGIIAEEANTLSDADERAEEIVATAQQEANELMDKAQQTAERIYNKAVAEYEAMINETNVYREATARAERILSESEDSANAIIDGAKSYADDILADVQRYFKDYIGMINNNRSELGARPRPKTDVTLDDLVKPAQPMQKPAQQSVPRPASQPVSEPQPVQKPAQQSAPRPMPQPKSEPEPTYDDEDYYQEEKPKKLGWFRRMWEGDSEDEYDDEGQPKKKRRKLFEFVDRDDEDEYDDYDDE